MEADILKITELVIEQIKKTHILTEKNFNIKYTRSNEAAISLTEHIATIVAAYCLITPDELKATGRTRGHLKFKWQRAIAYTLCRDIPEEPIPLATIGKVFNRDHATVLYWVGQLELKMSQKGGADIKHDYNSIKKEIEQTLAI
jgi:chromosomal replication initiation ATPase DnaA